MYPSRQLIKIGLGHIASHSQPGKDGKGFSHPDVTLAQKLLSKEEEWCDEDDLAGYQILRKYQRQLSAIGIDYQGIKPPRLYQEECELLEADTSTGRAKVVRRRIAPGYTRKQSTNGYRYTDDPFVKVAAAVNRSIDQGVPILSRLGHAEKGQRNETLPAISTLGHYREYKACHVDEATGEVFVVDHFLQPGTEKSVEWSERAYRKEYLPCSFESYSYCAKKIIEGTTEEEILCDVAQLFTVAWLDPSIDNPGMGEAAAMCNLFESTGRHCPCGCEPKPLTKNEAGSTQSSGGTLNTKGASKNMDYMKLAQDLYANGAPWEAAKAIMQGQGASDQDIAAAAIMFMDGGGSGDPMTGDNMPMPDPSMQSTNAPLYEMKKKRFDSLKAKKEAAARFVTATTVPAPAGTANNNETLLKTIEAQNVELTSMRTRLDDLIKSPPSPFSSEAEKNRFNQIMTERENLEKHVATKAKVYEILTAEKFLEHNLKDQRLYPVSLIKDLAKEAEGKIIKENLDFTSIALWIDGQLMGLAARAPEETSEANHTRFEFGEGSPVSAILKQLSEAADRAALQIDGGEERLQKREKIRKKLEPKVQRIVDYHRDAVGHVLHMAEGAIRDKKRGMRPDPELAAEGLATGLITNEAAAFTNTAVNVATQAFMSELIYNRIFEPADYLDVIAPLLRTELYDYKKGDPFSLQVGDEVKWALHSGVDPASLNELIVRTPGISPIAVARLDRKYDSVSLEELAIEYLYGIMQINSLRNTWNVDYIGAIGDYIADLMNRALSKFGMTKMENSARKFRSVEIAAEDSAAANLVVGRTIVTDGVSTTYGTTVSHIVRLEMDQTGLTGTNVIPRALVMPEYDKFNNPRGGKTSNILNAIVFTIDAGTYTWDDIGELDYATMNIVDRYVGQNAKFAIDFNNCVMLFKSTASVSAGNLPRDIKYSYVPLLTQTAGNLVVLDFTTPDTLSEAENINNILNTLTTVAALRSQQNHIRPNIFIGSKVFTDGILTRAQRWLLEFAKIGSELKPNFEDFNEIGIIGGGISLWGTDGYLLGQSNIGTLTRRGSTKVVFGEKVQASGMRWVDLTAAAENDPTRTTTAMRENWRQTFAFASPRVRDDAGLAYNEPGIVIRIKGTTFTA